MAEIIELRVAADRTHLIFAPWLIAGALGSYMCYRATAAITSPVGRYALVTACGVCVAVVTAVVSLLIVANTRGT